MGKNVKRALVGYSDNQFVDRSFGVKAVLDFLARKAGPECATRFVNDSTIDLLSRYPEILDRAKKNSWFQGLIAALKKDNFDMLAGARVVTAVVSEVSGGGVYNNGTFKSLLAELFVNHTEYGQDDFGKIPLGITISKELIDRESKHKLRTCSEEELLGKILAGELSMPELVFVVSSTGKKLSDRVKTAAAENICKDPVAATPILKQLSKTRIQNIKDYRVVELVDPDRAWTMIFDSPLD